MPSVIDFNIQVEIIQNLLQKIRACYIFPEVAEQIRECLQKHLADGDYNGIDEGDFFAYALTTHLQEITHDEHLWVRFHAEPLPEHDGQLRLNPEWQAARRAEAERENYGLQRVERLAGGVGLLELCYFHRPEWGGQAVAAALESFAGCRALILDLRQCTGGFPGMVALVCGHLFSQPVPLARIDWMDDGSTQEFIANPEGIERPLAGVPVYVLTSRQTFSAGEMCASALQSRARALVVGEKTDGGAHPGASYRLHPHFEAFIPIGRVTDLLTSKDWEGSGVTPDISLPQEKAFDAATFLALQASGIEEAQTVLKELAKQQKMCRQCYYSNPLYLIRCKNCGESLTDG